MVNRFQGRAKDKTFSCVPHRKEQAVISPHGVVTQELGGRLGSQEHLEKQNRIGNELTFLFFWKSMNATNSRVCF